MGNQILPMSVFCQAQEPSSGPSVSDRKAWSSYPTDTGKFHMAMPNLAGPPLSQPGGEKPCRACTDFKSWAKFQAQKRRVSAEEGGNILKNGGAGGASAPAGGGDFSNKRSQREKESEEDIEAALIAERAHLQCPLDKDELGRSTWSFLHTMAAYYPDQPSKTQEKEMSAFIKILAKYYPCEHCAQDFQKSIKESPPETWSRSEFSLWLCKMHNEVNRKLGKPEFDCERVDERWRDGWRDGSCDFDLN